MDCTVLFLNTRIYVLGSLLFGKDYTSLALLFGKRYMVFFVSFDLTFRNKYKSLEFGTM